MKTIELVFNKKVSESLDDFNNPIYSFTQISVPGCLIAPVTEPDNEREKLAMEQNRLQIRIHLPKTCSDDVSDSIVVWNSRKWRVDSDGTDFMKENCPTMWSRYFRAEALDV